MTTPNSSQDPAPESQPPQRSALLPPKKSSLGFAGPMLGVAGLLAAAFFWQLASAATVKAKLSASVAAAAEEKLSNAEAVGDSLIDAISSVSAQSAGKPIEWKTLLDRIETVASNLKDTAGREKVFRALGKAYKSQGRYRDAATLAQRAIESMPASTEPREKLRLRSELAINQLLAGDIPEGTALCDELLSKADSLELEATAPVRLALLNASANADFMRGKIDKGLPKAREAMRGRNDTIDDDDPNLLFALNSLMVIKASDGKTSEAIPLAERLTRLWEAQNPNHIAALAARNNLATLYGQKAGTQQKSAESLETVLTQMTMDHGAKDSRVLKLTSDYLRALIRNKNYDKAIAVGEPAVETAQEALGADDSITVANMNGLALAYHFAGRPKEASPILKVVLKSIGEHQGQGSDLYLQTIFDLAAIQFGAGEFDEAMVTAEQARELHNKHKGADHPRTQMMTFALADTCAKSQLHSKAAELFEEHYHWRINVRDEVNSDSIGSGLKAAMHYRLSSQPDKSIELLTDIRAKIDGASMTKSPLAIVGTIAMARAQKDIGNVDEAIGLANASLEKAKTSLGSVHGITCDARACQYEILMKRQQFSEAETAARELFDVIKDSPLANNLRLALAANMIAESQLRQGNAAGAIQLLSAIFGSLNKEHPEHTMTAGTNVLLGEAYLAESDTQKAEEHLTNGQATLDEQRDKLTVDDAVRLKQANELLVKLYESIGNVDRAAEFRSKSSEPL